MGTGSSAGGGGGASPEILFQDCLLLVHVPTPDRYSDTALLAPVTSAACLLLKSLGPRHCTSNSHISLVIKGPVPGRGSLPSARTLNPVPSGERINHRTDLTLVKV